MVTQSPEPPQFEGQQAEALDLIYKWLQDPGHKQKFILFGFAGTGKSTLAVEVASWCATQGVAFTGKAALELTKKGLDSMTIHSFCYAPDISEEGQLLGYRLRSSLESPPDLINLDECGMADKELDDALSSFGIPMLVMGDPFQLPALKGDSPYDNCTPDYQLTEIHRQAKDNPVIWMSKEIREGRRLRVGRYGDSRVVTKAGVRRRLDQLILDHRGESKIIVGRNSTRREFNLRARDVFEYKSPYPEKGELLICLKNERSRGLINGQMWEVLDLTGPFTHKCFYYRTNRYTGEVTEHKSVWGPDDPGPEGEQVTVQVVSMRLREQGNESNEVNVVVPVDFFTGDPDTLHWKQLAATSSFDFGHVLTAHKAQGSTFKNVLVYDESYIARENAARWRYSACTRPSNNLIFAI